jgi:hypothetical protein
MKSFFHIAGLLVPAAILLGGCAPSDNEIPLDDELNVSLDPAAAGGWYEPPTGKNGMLPLQFWSPVAQNAMRELGKVGLGSGGTYTTTTGAAFPKLPSLPHTTALLTAYPSVMKHLIECALSPTTSVYDPVNSTLYRGWWNLAPNWLTTPTGISSSSDTQAWVTGCMLARLNNLGAHVDILLEGNLSQIGVNTTYNGVFGYSESTVFANMFNSTIPPSNNSPAFYAYLCKEDNLAATCPRDGGHGWLDQRLCDNAPSTCGFVDIGRCSKPGGNCIANGEHWECKIPGGFIYNRPTVGVQLFDPVTFAECN